MFDQGRSFSPAIIFLAILMGCKAFYLAFFVTPLWDIPDEIGHLAYVMQIANGGGIPVLGDAMIPAEIMSHMRQADSPAAGNWIAQHPPIYYFIAAVPYWLAQQFTSDVEILYRAPRIIASLSAVILLLVLYRTARLTGLSERASLCLAGCIGWIPMFSHLASGTNHDVPLFLASALSAHFMARFVLQHNVRDAYIAAIWLSIAGAMKMTAWVLLPPFVFVIAWELRGTWRPWLAHLSGTTAVALSAPLVWMIRNFFEYGDPTYTATTDGTWRLEVPLQVSFLEFLHSQPVLEFFMRSFYGYIGGIGTGAGNLTWFQVGSLPRIAFTMTLLCCAAILLWHFSTIMRGTTLKTSSRFAHSLLFCRLEKELWPFARLFSVVAALSVFALSAYFSMKGDDQMNLRLYGISTVLALGAAACICVVFDDRDKHRLFFYGLAAFLFFSLVVIVNIYEFYLLDGRLRATHGRYFYPVVPWLLVSLSLALSGRVWGKRLLMLAFPMLVLAETDAYINQVLPFIGGGQ
ncbi:glycosyltransferase family 39 protein [Rhodobacteraceae bacterium XHP0102]|nr:glycosyltransferase family 39 protein [Rhodobacteraceae bacterium XHP0102]